MRMSSLTLYLMLLTSAPVFTACPTREVGETCVKSTQRKEKPKEWKDDGLLYVNRMFTNRLPSGDLALEEVLKGNCKPDRNGLDCKAEFYSYFGCLSHQRRIVYREPISGTIVHHVSRSVPKDEFVDDVLGFRYATLVSKQDLLRPSLERLGALPIYDETESFHKVIPMAMEAKVRERDLLIGTFKVKRDERISCARLVPNTSLIVLCIQDIAHYGDRSVGYGYSLSANTVLYSERIIAPGYIRVYDAKSMRLVHEARYIYRPVLRKTGPCSFHTLVPQGEYAWFDTDDCRKYIKECRVRPIAPCDSKYYKKVLPRSYDMFASPSPDGQYLAVVAFDDLYVYRIDRATGTLKLLAEHPSATYEDRDWHILQPRLSWSEESDGLLLFGQGQILRQFGGGDFKYVGHWKNYDFSTMRMHCYYKFPCAPVISAAYMDSKLFLYSLPDYSVGVQNRFSSSDRIDDSLHALSGERIYATMPACEAEVFKYMKHPQSIAVSKGKIIVNSGGVLFWIDRETFISERYLGYHNRIGSHVRW